MFDCKGCHITFVSADSFILHNKIFHKFADFYICTFNECNKKYDALKNLKKHVYSHETSSVLCKVDNSAALDNYIREDENLVRSHEGQLDIHPAKDEDVCRHLENVHFVVRFLTKLYENTSITRKVIQEVVENTNELLTDIFANIQSKLDKFEDSLPPEFAESVSLSLANPFNELLTEYKRFKFFEHSSDFINAEKVEIGKILDDKRKKGSVYLDYRWCYAYVVPIDKILKKFLQIENVLKTILDYIELESKVNSSCISSMFNASRWKLIKSKFHNKIVLPIFLYFDDVECGNPLGTQAGVHKIGCVYFSLGGIPPKFSSKLRNIFFWGNFYTSDRKLFGNSEIFKKFYEQLIFLETNGIKIDIGTETKTVYFTLFSVLGDNLGVNSILGISESFKANYFCRFCYCSREVCDTLCLENETFLRNPANYTHHFQSMSHGIKENCIFNGLGNYHVTTNFSCDIMHDLLEGICRYEMAQILDKLIYNDKRFKLVNFNKRIKYFDYDYTIDEGNKIPQIIEKHLKNKCLIMSASEMLSLIIYFPFLVENLVDFDDEIWSFYLLLYDITSYCFKKEIDISEIKYLKYIIKEHHSLYLNIFEGSLKPKHHFLIHYPGIIEKMGPLLSMSSMRYEAFHKIGKTNCHVVTSRINILKTLSLRYQLRLCHIFQTKDCLKSSLIFGATKFIDTSGSDGDKFEVDWIKYNGVHFKVGSAIYVTLEENAVFAIIKSIVGNKNNEVVFHCKILRLIDTCGYLKAYVVDVNSNVFEFISVEKLQIFRSFKVHSISGGRHVISMFSLH